MLALALLLGLARAEPATPLQVVCSYSFMRVHGPLDLHIPGTSTAWATVRGGWRAESALADAELGARDGVPVLSLLLAEEGSSARGEVEPAGLLWTMHTVELSPHATLLEMGPLRVVGFGEGSVRVVAFDSPIASGEVELGCDDLTYNTDHGRPRPSFGRTEAGISAIPTTVYVKAGAAKELLDAPGGQIIGSFPAATFSQGVGELSRSGSHVEIGDINESRLYWRAWIAARHIKAEPDPRPLGPSILVDGLIGKPSGHDCPFLLPITATVGEFRLVAGVLGPGVRFQVVDGSGDTAEITPLDGWLVPAEGARWFVPKAALDCPVK